MHTKRNKQQRAVSCMQCQGRILKQLNLKDPTSLNAAEGLFPSVVSCSRVLHAANVGGCQNDLQSHGNVK